MKILTIITILIFIIQSLKSQTLEELNIALKKANKDTTKVRILDDILEACDEKDIEKYANESLLICAQNIETVADVALKKYFLKYKARAFNGKGLYVNLKGDYVKALEYLNESYKILELLDEKKDMASVINSIGAIYYTKGDIPKALENYKQSMLISEELDNKAVLPSNYSNIALVYLQQGKVDDALGYLEKSIKISEDIGKRENLAICYNNLSAIYKSKGDIVKTIECLEKGLAINKEFDNKLGMANSLNNLGFLYKSKGSIEIATDFYYKSLKIREEIGDKKGVSISYNNLATLKIEQGDTTKAIEDYKKSLKIKEEIGDRKGEATVLNNIGAAYIKKEESKIALFYLEKSLKIYEEVEDKTGVATALGNIGNVYIKLGDVKKGLEYRQKGLDIFEAIGDKQGVAIALNRIAKTLIENGYPNDALSYANKSLKFAQEMGFPEEIKDAASALKKIYLAQNKPKEALEMLKLEKQMVDSLKNTETVKTVIENELNYNYNKKTEIDSIKNTTEKIIASAKLSKQRNQKLAFASLALLALGGIGFTFYLYKQKKKTNVKVNKQNETLRELNTELIESEEQLVKSNETKEQLISMMSHDLLNPITAITNYNQQIINRPNNTEDLLNAFKTVDAAIQPMHSLLDNMLQWTTIQKEGINAKLKLQDINEIVKEIISIYKPQANLKFIKLNEILQTDFVTETDKSILSLILRNLLNNAIKYSANQTSILITTITNEKLITIQDEGFGMTDEMIGFLNNKQFDKIEAKGSGLGLKLCFEFAKAIGAKIIFSKNENKGTIAKVKLT